MTERRDGKWLFDAGPAPEVLEYFEQKALKPSFDWRDVWAEEHAIAFTVAKTTGFDVLKDIHEELRRALKEGLPFAEFRKRLEPRLRAKGWWGRKEVTDPASGEVVEAQLGSRRRLKVIYEANMRTARGGGQWARAQRTKRMLPYFEYRLGPSREHRAHHAAWAARPTILPVDDPWWDTHYPPNGWGCKCWLRQISRREAERLGGPIDSPSIEYRNWINRRTGQIEKIPVGIDPGWHTNPGKARARRTMGAFFERLERDGGDAARAAMRDFWRSGIWRAWIRLQERVHMPAAILAEAARDLDAKSPVISISNDTLAAKISKHVDPKKHLPEDEERRKIIEKKRWAVKVSADDLLKNLPNKIENGIYVGKRLKDGKWQIWVVVEAINILWKVVIAKGGNGYLYLKTIHPTDEERLQVWTKE